MKHTGEQSFIYSAEWAVPTELSRWGILKLIYVYGGFCSPSAREFSVSQVMCYSRSKSPIPSPPARSQMARRPPSLEHDS